MVTSVSQQADCIGTRVSSSAFVYGAMSFLDKFSNGVAIYFVQAYRQALSEAPCDFDRGEACPAQVFTRQAFTVGCGGSALLGMVFAWFLLTVRRRASEESTSGPAPF